MDTAPMCGHAAAHAQRVVVVGLMIWLAAMSLMYWSVPSGVGRIPVTIDGPDGKPCVGTLYHRENPSRSCWWATG